MLLVDIMALGEGLLEEDQGPRGESKNPWRRCGDRKIEQILNPNIRRQGR